MRSVTLLGRASSSAQSKTVERAAPEIHLLLFENEVLGVRSTFAGTDFEDQHAKSLAAFCCPSSRAGAA